MMRKTAKLYLKIWDRNACVCKFFFKFKIMYSAFRFIFIFTSLHLLYILSLFINLSSFSRLPQKCSKDLSFCCELCCDLFCSSFHAIWMKISKSFRSYTQFSWEVDGCHVIEADRMVELWVCTNYLPAWVVCVENREWKRCN